MITSVVKCGNPEQMSFPFLWRSKGGCVYLRNNEGFDIIIGPVSLMGEIGKVCPGEGRVDNATAWEQRLSPSVVIELSNRKTV